MTEVLTKSLCVQLSPGCRSLLDAIFQADVKQRITVEGIMQHPWYREPLPSQFQSQWDQMVRVQSQKEADQQSRQLDPVHTIPKSSQVHPFVMEQYDEFWHSFSSCGEKTFCIPDS